MHELLPGDEECQKVFCKENIVAHIYALADDKKIQYSYILIRIGSSCALSLKERSFKQIKCKNEGVPV